MTPVNSSSIPGAVRASTRAPVTTDSGANVEPADDSGIIDLVTLDGTTFDLLPEWVGKVVEIYNPNPITLDITDYDATFPDGGVIEIVQTGAGVITFVSSGPAIQSVDGLVATSGQYAAVSIRKASSGPPGQYHLVGNLA